MNTEIAKYILWILLCLPIVFLGIHLVGRLFSDIYALNRKRIEQIKQREKEMEEEKENRRRFDELWQNFRGERYN